MDTNMAMADLPELPVAHEQLAKHIADHPEKPVNDLIQPYRDYESQLRTVYAQDRTNAILEDPYLNVLPLFTEDTKHIKTRARDLTAETDEEKSKYIMPLPEDKRRPNGSPATVANFSEFQKNFNVFSESSLVDLKWDNVVAAGSSVVNCLLPVPKEFNTTKRKLREYYHEKFCPASDVDLFLYGLNHDQAIEKIKQIEQSIRDALLNEVTVVRTKYAITIASQYPVRHIQIVLRVYKSVSEILTGFDIDAAGGAYNGKQVYVTPRALGSFITQVNHIDLTRRSPSYENRLSKYSHRNFEVYWPDLDRTRIDPTIFERSFQRTLGLARLLVLERLPTNSAREAYLNKRRQERGRPSVYRHRFQLGGNIKDHHEDEVADWLSEEEVSNYHTFTVPYGERFNAKRIEKLCYTRDLLLNAEWNQPKERREMYLHRHPAFFGRVNDVIEDCCGACPKPQTEEEKELAKKEAEIYISGKVSFLIDDPGRQQIGSFNPLTEQDWTDMAYVGNTARLCQSIVDGDIDFVSEWLKQDDNDPNTRDYTGRAPLHLAVSASTPEVVKLLVDHGARLTARLADGRTALHLAAARGNSAMIKILMDRSIENEEAEEERKDQARAAKRPAKPVDEANPDEDADNDEDWAQSETDAHSATTGSFIKIKKEDEDDRTDVVPDEPEDEPDFYQIDVLSWDVPCSPLHVAIVGGHEEAVESLCNYGADSILPIKFLNKEDPDDVAAILTLTLALSLSPEKAKSMVRLLLNRGAISSQADNDGMTAFHRFIESGKLNMVEALFTQDQAGVRSAINHLVFAGYRWNPEVVAPLHTAIENGDPALILGLLEAGAKSEIDYETWLKAAKVSPTQSSRLQNSDLETNKKSWKQMEQPLITAIRLGQTEAAMKLLEAGANPNQLTPTTENLLHNEYQRRYTKGKSALDSVNSAIKGLKKNKSQGLQAKTRPEKKPGLDEYLEKHNFQPGTYSRWIVARDVKSQQDKFQKAIKSYEKDESERENQEQAEEDKRQSALAEIIADFQTLHEALIKRGAKTFEELYPDIKTEENSNRYSYGSNSSNSEIKPYEYNFKFRYDSDMTDTRNEGYLNLFEAAWSGDLESIKDLTLQAWGTNKDQPPLKASIQDDERNTPFLLAFCRGHLDVAQAILEIVKAQWSPKDKDDIRYKIKAGSDDEEDYSDEDSASDDDDDPKVVSEKVVDKFTIDTVGQVSMQVESHDKPLHVLMSHGCTFRGDDSRSEDDISEMRCEDRSPFTHCLAEDDSTGLKFLLDQAQHWAKDGREGEEDDEDTSPQGFVFPNDAYEYAITNGKTQLLGMIIKRTGAGIPLDHLVKKSGVKINKKPRYYQGLTVYGKKRKDWATAGRNMVTRTSGSKTPPLLRAALAGSIESVEFFLGDAPNRLYSEFGKSKVAREDIRLKGLRDSSGGFDRAVARWLGADNDLVIHCAVLGPAGKRTNELVEYLVQTCPSALEKKNPQGETPLMVACRLGRRQVVNILIDGSADQTTRNNSGENIVHVSVLNATSAHRLRALLDEFDPELRAALFTQRKNLSDNGYTPVQLWIAQATHNYSGGYLYSSRPTSTDNPQAKLEMAKLLLEYCNGQGLDLLDSAGDTCLHTAVMRQEVAIAKALVDYKPALLYRENAVGRTPAEIAEETLKSKPFTKPNRFRSTGSGDRNWSRMRWDALKHMNKKSTGQPEPLADSSAVQALGLRGDYTVTELANIRSVMGLSEEKTTLAINIVTKLIRRMVWDFFSTTMDENPSPRRLVSLNEANDVARRLGEQETRSRYFSVHSRRGEDDEEEEEDQDKDEDVAPSVLNEPRAWQTYFDEFTDGLEKCGVCEKYHE